jgi:nucleoside-diphosphate-sugar epimerase
MSTILVTGGSGFVGSHMIRQLLSTGHTVRTTIRNLNRESEVRAIVKGAGPDDCLSFFAADLEKDAGWADAVQGCDYVMHVASPFPAKEPKDENELIVPAREGALRVLRASRDAGVKLVVLTSSFAAIGYGHPPQTTPFDESSWTDVNANDVPAYHKSKTLAERAAWDFIAKEGGPLELAVINPVGIFGPVLAKDLCSSVQIIESMLTGALPGLPQISFGAVDVRDAVDLHIRAMTNPAAKGERFIATACESTSLIEIAQILKSKLGAAAAKVPTRKIPSFLVRIGAIFKPEARPALPELGKVKRATSKKAETMLGWKPRSLEDAIVATAESLVRLRLP